MESPAPVWHCSFCYIHPLHLTLSFHQIWTMSFVQAGFLNLIDTELLCFRFLKKRNFPWCHQRPLMLLLNRLNTDCCPNATETSEEIIQLQDWKVIDAAPVVVNTDFQYLCVIQILFHCTFSLSQDYLWKYLSTTRFVKWLSMTRHSCHINANWAMLSELKYQHSFSSFTPHSFSLLHQSINNQQHWQSDTHSLWSKRAGYCVAACVPSQVSFIS